MFFGTFCKKTLQHEGARGIKVNQHLISLSATVPGLKRCGRLTPPVRGADALLRADVAAGIFFGARPPVDFLAVCLVLRQRQRAETEGASGSWLRKLPCHFASVAAALPFMH